MKGEYIVIRPPHSKLEYLQACGLVQAIYQDHSYIKSLNSNPSTLFLAEKNGSIIGSVGLFIANDGCLPTERYYDFQLSDILPSATSQNTFEIGRLGSVGKSSTDVLIGLILAIIGFATNNGHEQAIACMKPGLQFVLERRLKIPLHRIEKVVCLNHVEEEYLGYFSTEPMPVAVYFLREDLERYLVTLQSRIAEKVLVDLGDCRQIRFEDLPIIIP